MFGFELLVCVLRRFQRPKASFYIAHFVSAVADYSKKQVKITVEGKVESRLNGKSLKIGESAVASEGDVIEVIKGSLLYKVSFSPSKLRNSSPEGRPNKRLKTEESLSKMSTTENAPSCDETKDLKSGFTWVIHRNSVLSCNATFENNKNKVASFDLDGTIIKTKSGAVFPKGPQDWMIWDSSVKPALKKLYNENYNIVIFTNQLAFSVWAHKISPDNFKNKIEDIVKLLDVPISVYISMKDDYFRKPCMGMWELMTDLNPDVDIDMAHSFYVGDAAGRPAWKPGVSADFASSDRYYANNIGIKFYTPEEYFLKEPPVDCPIKFDPRYFDTSEEKLDVSKYNIPSNELEAIIMVGSPASGKSHFIRKHLIPHGYIHVSRDELGTWQKCVVSLKKHLQDKKSVVIDNTNPDVQSRQRYLDVCKELGVKARCFIMVTKFERCIHNNKFRMLTDKNHVELKATVLEMFIKSYVEPEVSEGFAEIINVPFVQEFSSFTHKQRKLYNNFLVGKSKK